MIPCIGPIGLSIPSADFIQLLILCRTVGPGEGSAKFPGLMLGLLPNALCDALGLTFILLFEPVGDKLPFKLGGGKGCTKFAVPLVMILPSFNKLFSMWLADMVRVLELGMCPCGCDRLCERLRLDPPWLLCCI